MRLTAKESEILGALEMQADAPLSVIARRAGCRESAVRYQLQRFIEQRVIVTRRIYIDPYPLGYTNYAVYFSLAAEQQQIREQIRTEIPATHGVTWFAEVGGDFQYAFSFSAEHISEVVRLMDAFSEKYSGIFFEKSVSIRVAVHTFGRKYLCRKPYTPTELFQGGSGAYSIDVSDHRILSALGASRFDSHRELARQLSIPPTTFERRLTRLKEKNVITGCYYILDISKLNRLEFRLLISAGGADPPFKRAMLEFARRHPHVRKYVECVGGWEFELEVDVAEGRQTSDITGALYHQFGARIRRVAVVPLFGEVSCPPYSFL